MVKLTLATNMMQVALAGRMAPAAGPAALAPMYSTLPMAGLYAEAGGDGAGAPTPLPSAAPTFQRLQAQAAGAMEEGAAALRKLDAKHGLSDGLNRGLERVSGAAADQMEKIEKIDAAALQQRLQEALAQTGQKTQELYHRNVGACLADAASREACLAQTQAALLQQGEASVEQVQKLWKRAAESKTGRKVGDTLSSTAAQLADSEIGKGAGEVGSGLSKIAGSLKDGAAAGLAQGTDAVMNSDAVSCMRDPACRERKQAEAAAAAEQAAACLGDAECVAKQRDALIKGAGKKAQALKKQLQGLGGWFGMGSTESKADSKGTDDDSTADAKDAEEAPVAEEQ